MKHLPRETAALAAKQAGMLSRSQLAIAGFDSRHIARRIELGYWAAITDRVVSIGPSPWNRESELWAASLHYESGYLTGRAALEVLGFPGSVGDRVDIAHRESRRNPPLPMMVVHQRAKLNSGLTSRCVPVAAATVDAMRFDATLRQRCFTATWMIQRQHVELSALIDECARTNTINGSHHVVKALGELSVGIEAMSELVFDQLCRKFQVPKPSRQMRRVDSEGRPRYLDASWESPSRTVIAEIDGRGHLDYKVRLDDMFRDNSMALQGSITLRIPYLALRLEPARWMAQVRKALS